MIEEKILLPEVKNEIINAVLNFGSIATMEYQLEALHTWMIDYLDLIEGDNIKDNLNVYLSMRSLIKEFKAIEEKYKTTLTPLGYEWPKSDIE